MPLALHLRPAPGRTLAQLSADCSAAFESTPRSSGFEPPPIPAVDGFLPSS